MEKITGIAMAGGKSSRMGSDKAFLKFQDKMLIEYTLDLLKASCNEVLIIANQPDFEQFGFPIINDEYKDIGPIGGLHACLKNSTTQYVLCIACDMPFANQSLLFGLLKHIDDQYDIISYSYQNRPQPLFAIYSKSILPQIERQIGNGNYKLQNLFRGEEVMLIPLGSDRLIANINSLNDLSLYRKQFVMKHPKMMLIAGDGRNVGKTHFACLTIKHLSKKNEVVGIKTTTHFYDTYNESDILEKTEDYIVVLEKGNNKKDSSLMRQAGASTVYFIMANPEGLSKAIGTIAHKLKDRVVVAESGGLSEVVVPGLFFFIRERNKPLKKKQYLRYNPIIVENVDHRFSLNVQKINVSNNYLKIVI